MRKCTTRGKVCTKQRDEGGARGKKVGCTAEIGWEEGVHQGLRGGGEVEVEVQVRVRGAESKRGSTPCNEGVCTKQRGGSVQSRGWGEEGGSGVKKVCTVQIRWCAPGVGGGRGSRFGLELEGSKEQSKIFFVNQGRTRNQVGIDEEVYERRCARSTEMSVCTRGGARGKKVGCTAEIGWEEGVHQGLRGGGEVEVEVQVRVRGAERVEVESKRVTR
ncbi:hypothetical protein PMAC_002138 [Pneumocystis sp. 'macacae']|nr:hypothetical protein PMAC_002138 [Pneumocystis sp. 'macacae']